MALEVPEGWQSQKLGEIAEIVGGSTPSKKVPEYWENGEVPWATPTDITKLPVGQRIIAATENRVTAAGLNETSLRLLPPGAVLMTSRATIGYTAINEVPITTNQGFANFLPNPETWAPYLAYWLENSRETLKSISGGSTFLEVSKKSLKALPIALPPLPEQKKIAEVLSSVDEAIVATKAVIDQTKQVKKGLLQTLLTKGIGHTKFKQTELGEIPESWEEVRLGDIVKGKDGLQTGPFGSQLKAAEYTEDGIPVVMPKDLIDRKISLRSIARTSSQKADTLAKHKLVKGDILFGRRGEIGRCGLVTENETGFLCGTGCLRARLNTSIVYPDFFIAYLSLPFTTSWLNENAVGQTMLNLNTAILAALPIALPPLEEQRKIANVISEFDSSSRANSKKLDQLQTIKSGLMSDLLTGRKRVEV